MASTARMTRSPQAFPTPARAPATTPFRSAEEAWLWTMAALVASSLSDLTPRCGLG